MSNEPRMFRINTATKEAEPLTIEQWESLNLKEVDFGHLGLWERWDIQEWIAADSHILGDDLMIIDKEFSDFKGTQASVDLVAVDKDGKLAIIELKRDDSGADVHWQAIKYASYLSDTTKEEIVRMFKSYAPISMADAETNLQDHIGKDLCSLNHDQRIILASHRFDRRAKTAALWLNEKPGKT